VLRSDWNIAHLLVQATSHAPETPAFVTRDRVVSWREFSERAGAFASALEAMAVAPGDRVALFIDRGPDAAAALFGAYATGAVPINLNTRFRTRQVDQILSDARAAAIICAPELPGLQARRLKSRVALIDPSTVPASDALHIRPVAHDALAQIIYTSGSTGLPKGVMFSNRALLSGIATVGTYLGLRPQDRVAGVLSFAGVYGLNQLLTAVAAGATLVVETSPLAAEMLLHLRAAQITVLAAVPPLWMQLLAVPGFAEPIPSLRLVQNAGGHLPIDVVRKIRTLQPQADLYLQYGMTETWRSAFLPPAEVDENPGSMGRAVPGAEILVVRPDGSACAMDEPGELVFTGPSMATGYWNAPEASARAFRPHPARAGVRAVFSGDIVRHDAEGRLFYVGRHDRIINTLGFRVGPDEIAEVLHASGHVSEAVVAAELDVDRGQRIIAIVVLSKNGSVEALRRYCREELPLYMQPARFDVVASIPRLPSGKYDIDARV
jgi:acyl-CoA synthetase (AMP-forming)/AMP-acid ligase II